MAWWLVLAVILFIGCAALLVAEVFLPSGGIISILSLACLVGGLVIFFKISTTAGIIGLIVALVMIPTILIISYKTLPNTKFGKIVLLSPPTRQIGDAIPDTTDLTQMKGRTGRVITPLRPVGTVDFDGKRLECVSETGFISNDIIVQVLKVEGTQLTVRPVEST